LAHVAEDHRLNVDGGAQQAGDVVEFAIADGAGGVPRTKYRVDGVPKLLHAILGEHLANVLLIDLLVLVDHVLELLGGQIAVDFHAGLLLGRVDLGLEVLVMTTHDDVAEHVDEPAIDVVGEARVACLLDDAFDHVVVEAQIQDGVHHAGHGDGGAGSHADQQRTARIAHLGVHRLLQLGHVLGNLFGQTLGPLAAGLVVFAADLRGDRETGRDRHAQARHLGKVRPFAPQEFLHLGIAFGLSAAEEIHPFVSHAYFLLLFPVRIETIAPIKLISANAPSHTRDALCWGK